MPARAGLATVGAALALGAGIAFTNAESVISQSFATALAQGSGDVVAQVQTPTTPLVAGSEDYWLSRKASLAEGNVEPAAWSLPSRSFAVTAGDQITITTGGKVRNLEVVSVQNAPAAVTRIETGEAAGHRLVVTCRDTSDGRLFQFVTGTDETAPRTSSSKPVRAL
jgi:hypothetical protein